MKGILSKIIKETKAYNQLMVSIDSGSKHIGLSNIEDTLKSVYSIILKDEKNLLIICENELLAKKYANDINKLVPNLAYFFNSEPSHFYFVDSHSKEIAFNRIMGLHNILFSKGKVVVTSFDALFKKMLSSQYYTDFYVLLELEDIIPMENLVNKLIKSGYERTVQVENKGQFAIKGGLIDIFNVIDDEPIRIEFFDDEIDSIRLFDINSQRSIKKLEKTIIAPAKEIIFTDSDKALILKKFNTQMSKYKRKIETERDKKFNELIQNYESGRMNKLDPLIPYYSKDLNSIVDYFNNDNIFVMNNADKFKSRYESFITHMKEDYKGLLEKGEVLPSFFERIFTFEEVTNKLLNLKTIDFQSFNKKNTFVKYDNIIDAKSKPTFSFYGKLPDFINQLLKWNKEEYTIFITVNSEQNATSIRDMLLEYSIVGHLVNEDNIIRRKINILKSPLEKGVVLIDDKCLFITEKEIYNIKDRNKRKNKPKGKQIESFTQLNIGDYIVHDTHGIGVYMGIEQIIVEGIKKDYLHLKYAKGDKLYIPVDQMESVQTYIGFGDKHPRISKLGSHDWQKAKQYAKDSVKDMAQDLIKVYAQRRHAKGYAYSVDSNWVKEFEEKFPYEETEDQLRAIIEVKGDMERAMPMDRLLCGDVGYGKTEVAIRAAFKTVMDNKQVAILVPTTILAQQHYNSFVQRFEDYPIKIEMLSRFRSKKRQDGIVSELKKHGVDIVVGTHRMLSKDIFFDDLGLLIIDEEQRFGVRHKEKIKELKANIDVLTLSATPIPRTLHMSMIGIRDMSILNEPPGNRTPVQTYVMEYNEVLIKDAIEDELSRKGQVFYVYNKVEDIDFVAAKVNKMVPNAKINIAHGQMSETQLEKK